MPTIEKILDGFFFMGKNLLLFLCFRKTHCVDS